MQPQQNFSGSGSGPGDPNAAIVCAKCGAPMPREMRFCRSCGNRLGEGPAEYTETVRFPNATAAANGRFTGAYTPGPAAPIAQQTARGLSCQGRRRRLGFSGMTWMWIVLGLFFASGGLMSAFVKNVRNIPRVSMPALSRSYVGVDGFQTTDGGVTFDVVEPPDGPADKAGLVGGDIITSFDGHPVKDESEIMDLLAKTPTGKRVEVIYLRDGSFHYGTQLTTVSEAEFSRLRSAFNNRPEGKGMFGFESDRMTRIRKPETKTFGVRIDYVEPNGPADLFGIKVGDIITDFDNIPIRTADEFLSRVRRATPYTPVDIGVLRDGQRIVVSVKMGKAR